jgi:hypothetical protein
LVPNAGLITHICGDIFESGATPNALHIRPGAPPFGRRSSREVYAIDCACTGLTKGEGHLKTQTTVSTGNEGNATGEGEVVKYGRTRYGRRILGESESGGDTDKRRRGTDAERGRDRTAVERKCAEDGK